MAHLSHVMSVPALSADFHQCYSRSQAIRILHDGAPRSIAFSCLTSWLNSMVYDRYDMTIVGFIDYSCLITPIDYSYRYHKP